VNSEQGLSEGKGLMGGKNIGIKLPKQCKNDYDCNPGGVLPETSLLLLDSLYRS